MMYTGLVGVTLLKEEDEFKTFEALESAGMIAILDEAYEDHEVKMFWLNVEPPFEPLCKPPHNNDSNSRNSYINLAFVNLKAEGGKG